MNKIIKVKQIFGGIVPHAAYTYAAKEAVHFFHYLKVLNQEIDMFIILNLSHSGVGEEVSLDAHSEWETPLGNVKLMEFLNIPSSNDAQRKEHSAEIVLTYCSIF